MSTPPDWSTWVPQQKTVLIFIVKEGQILLIRKKRGLGAGKINGPGGKIDPGETSLQAATRESQEEIGITPLHLVSKGELHFQFSDGFSLHCEVFQGDDFTGTLIETPEAVPLWFSLAEIPYHEMWEDDPHWLPDMLEDRAFRGYFTFEGERMLTAEVNLQPSAAGK
jgi:8-oxo-dGTP diphosphatase